MGPEIIAAIGTALAGVVGAFVGGKNSLNGFKARVDSRFDSVDASITRLDGKVDRLTATDGSHEARLVILEAKGGDEDAEAEALEDARS